MKKKLPELIGWIILITILAFIYSYVMEMYASNHLTVIKDQFTAIETLHAACLIFLTSVLVCIAGIQLSGIAKTTQSDFLMRLDNRYASDSILKARVIIQHFYRESKNLNPAATESVHRYYIGIKINEMSEDINSSEGYVYLLNLLEFLESISFFANRKDLQIEDILNLMGLSLVFYYDIFKPRIEARRNKYSHKSMYAEFEKLVEKINCRGNKG